MPSEAEARKLLEDRKKFHIPDEDKRIYPSAKEDKAAEKTKKAEKAEKTEKKERKRDSSSTESAVKEVSAEVIKTAVPLKIRPAEGEVPAPQKKQAFDKGKGKMGESASVVEPVKEVAYNRRDVVPFSPTTLFSELGYKGMVTRFNRASAQLVNQVDVNHLDSVNPLDRVRQLQTSAAEVIFGCHSLSCWIGFE